LVEIEAVVLEEPAVVVLEEPAVVVLEEPAAVVGIELQVVLFVVVVERQKELGVVVVVYLAVHKP
jgi:hypothetical protein